MMKTLTTLYHHCLILLHKLNWISNYNFKKCCLVFLQLETFGVVMAKTNSKESHVFWLEISKYLLFKKESA